jgi:hypothetical protein
MTNKGEEDESIKDNYVKNDGRSGGSAASIPYRITSPRIILCRSCTGQGFVLVQNGEDYRDCPSCGGSGKELSK